MWCSAQHNACMASITIRGVPDSARDELAARAKRTGRSLQEYLRSELIELAGRPDAAAHVARIRDRKRQAGTQLSRQQILDHRDAGRP